MEIKDNNGIKLYCFSKQRHNDNDCVDMCSLAEAREEISKNPPYREAYYCFFLCEKGYSYLSIGGQSGTVEMNSIVCGLPGELWEWKLPLNKETEGRFLFFEPEFILAPFKDSDILQRMQFLDSEKRNPFILLDCETFKRIRDLMNQIEVELRQEPRDSVMLHSLLWTLILIIDRAYKVDDNKLLRRSEGGCAASFVSLVNRYIHTEHGVEFYARCLCISPNYLNKLVHKNLGVSTREYILQRLMSEAKSMLRIHRMNIKEIAASLGFASSSYFIRLFKKTTGRTPNEYRQLERLSD